MGSREQCPKTKILEVRVDRKHYSRVTLVHTDIPTTFLRVGLELRRVASSNASDTIQALKLKRVDATLFGCYLS